MKRRLITLSIPVLLLASCSKDLNQNPISTTTTETFYATKQDFLQAQTSVYSIALRGTTLPNSYGYPDRQLNLSETRSDNLYAITDGTRLWEGINAFSTSLSTNDYVEEAYVNNYAAIGKANLFLEKLASNKVVIGDDALATRMAAEVRFIRAFCYFDLVRWFGKVPVVDKTTTAQEALAIPRSPVADVYKLILSDLAFAKDNLPPSYTAATDKGRATSYAAKTLLALVYMTRSGPTYSIDGPGLGLNEWSTAAGLLNEVIAGPYTFINTYSSIFSYTNENNSEVIFDVQYQSGGQSVGGSFVWTLTPDGYFQSLGLATQGSLYQRPVSNDFLSKFPVTDLRRQFSIKDGYSYQSQTYNYSFYKKFVDVSKYGSSRTDWPLNFIVWRITDVMLLKAECILHDATLGTQADVDAIVNKVRTRAGYTTPVAGTTLASLMEERREEFCGEGSRWHDLVRSGLVTTIMPAWIAADDVEHRILPFNKNYIIYPIPLREMNVKPGLYIQNLGYD
jgi:hypothetical protein